MRWGSVREWISVNSRTERYITRRNIIKNITGVAKVKITIEIEIDGEKQSYSVTPNIKTNKRVNLDACSSSNVGDQKTEPTQQETMAGLIEKYPDYLSRDLTPEEVKEFPTELKKERKRIFNIERCRAYNAKRREEREKKKKNLVISQDEADEIVASELEKKYNPFEGTESVSQFRGCLLYTSPSPRDS